MKSYSVMKAKAIEFASNRNQDVYIIKANKNNHMMIVFDKADIPPRHTIIETISPKETED